MLPIYLSFLFITTGFALTLTDYPFNRPEIKDFISYISSSTNLTQKFTSANDYTLLAPTNDALKIWMANNYTAGLVNATFDYHLLNGVHSSSSLKNGSQLLVSDLTDKSFCNVTGGQRVEVQEIDGNVVFETWLKNTSRIVSPDLLAEGGIVHIIDTVLELPSGVFDTLPRANLSYAVEIISMSNLVSADNFDIAQSIGWNPDVTFFMPNSAAAVAHFNTTGRNQNDLTSQLSYHCADRLLYESDFVNGTQLPTLVGVPLTVTVDEDGSVYVNSAKVIAWNYLVDNGVMHVIDDILNPYNITIHRPTQNATVTSTAVSTTTPTSVHTTTPTPISNKRGLSTGAKAGIGAGIGALVLILALGGLLLYQRRKNAKSNQEVKPPEYGTEKNPLEMSSGPIDEIPQLQTIESPVEMMGDVPRRR